MSGGFLSVVSGASGAGHPIWHFALVAGAAIAVFGGIKASEWWQHHERLVPRPSAPTVVLAMLGAGSSLVHAVVCPEHFREWVVFGVFFVLASALQAAWSVLVLIRPNNTVLAVGAAGNWAVAVLFVLSRTTGTPFGPEPFRPERLTGLGIVATACELAIVAGSYWLICASRCETARLREAVARANPA